MVVPLSGREIPIIADDYVDMEFGTGALKITPGEERFTSQNSSTDSGSVLYGSSRSSRSNLLILRGAIVLRTEHCYSIFNSENTGICRSFCVFDGS